ncbi:Gamma-tubulin complex component 3 -like protein [Babesia sp. Xinjiang]|uniref:Gamma-tubulin complex component 3 -like protein n=1 Tax=Babesia sp. Xinjiang TaxID=462227 RepID=UPI000A23FFA5|nr:Gamma-tubulin complex component 3 -like protein [Babesia sp. Xinjiang]ORM40315.1 Gamma-tubulin complex component 3 -like protein [Babesia sp. Xinjiang]
MSERRRQSGSTTGNGGAFLANEVMLLAYHISQISKEDILQYNLDRLHLSPGIPPRHGDSSSTSTRPTGHIVRLHDLLQRHLEETTVRLLSECADMEVDDIDVNSIARDLEIFCVDNASISLRRLKGMLYTGMQCFERLPACLKLLLLLKDSGEQQRAPSLGSDGSRGIDASAFPTPESQNDDSYGVYGPSPVHPIEEIEPSDDSSAYSSAESSPYKSPEEIEHTSEHVHRSDGSPEVSVTSVVTNRFEFSEIDEYDLVSDILFVLQGIEGRFIKHAANGRFTLTSHRQVSRGVRQLTERICALGTLYHSIVNSKPPEGLISQALYQGVMDEVHQYNHLINVMVSSRNNEPLTLLRLYVLVQQPYTRMRLLYMALDRSPGLSIDRIFDLYCTRGDAMGRELYGELLRKCTIPYLELLLRWVYYGELEDVYRVFFVRHVEGQYRLIQSKVPKFFSQELAELCFDVGCCSRYYYQLKSSIYVRGSVDITGLLHQLCPQSQSWSIFVTVQHLLTVVRSIGTSTELVRELVGKHDLGGYLRRVSGHLGMEHLGADRTSPVFDDFECTKEYGFEIYVPLFSFPLALIFEDEKEARESYITCFRMEFLLQRALKILSICWEEYSWNSRCSHGALDLSRRVNWMNLCRNEMSHFANMLQKGRNVPYMLGQLISRISSRDYPPAGTTLSDLRGECSAVFFRLRGDNFLEIMDILESIVDYCRFILPLFNRAIMHQLQVLVCEGATPSSLIDFIHSHIATDDVMKIMATHAKRFREGVLLLLHRLSCQDPDRRRFGLILDYNNFYRLLSAIES